MGELVLVGGCEMRAHAAVVTSYYDAAAAGGFGGGDHVFGVEACIGACLAESFGVFVFPDAAYEEDGVWGKNILGRQEEVFVSF